MTKAAEETTFKEKAAAFWEKLNYGYKKIDVSDRTQAAVFAIKNNIVKLY